MEDRFRARTKELQIETRVLWVCRLFLEGVEKAGMLRYCTTPTPTFTPPAATTAPSAATANYCCCYSSY